MYKTHDSNKEETIHFGVSKNKVTKNLKQIKSSLTQRMRLQRDKKGIAPYH